MERFCRAQGETKGIRDFISVLFFYRDYRASEVEAAVELALEKNISASDGVRHILIYTNSATGAFVPLSEWSSLPLPDVAVYGQLGGVQ